MYQENKRNFQTYPVKLKEKSKKSDKNRSTTKAKKGFHNIKELQPGYLRGWGFCFLHPLVNYPSNHGQHFYTHYHDKRRNNYVPTNYECRVSLVYNHYLLSPSLNVFKCNKSSPIYCVS